MPIVFGVIGILLIVAGVRGTLTAPANPNLVSLVKDDLTGNPNYLEWMTAIFIIGALGYVPQLRTLSRAFMTIVVIGLLFANRGFFAAFAAQTSGAQSGPIISTTGMAKTLSGIQSITSGANSIAQPTPSLTIPNVLNNIFGPGIG